MLFCLAGTTGDVLPGLTLATGAASAGAEVTVATHAPFQGQVERLGLQFAPIPGSHDDLFDTNIGALLRSTRGRTVAHAAGTVALVRGVQPALFEAISALAIDDQHVLVYTPLCSPLQYFADAEGVSGVALHYQTAFPTGRHGSPYVSAPTSSVPALNKFSFDLSLQLESLLIAPSARKEAKRHGLQMPRQHGLLLGAWNRAALHLQAVSPWLCRSVPLSPFEEMRTGFLAVPGGAFQPIPDEVLAAHERRTSPCLLRRRQPRKRRQPQARPSASSGGRRARSVCWSPIARSTTFSTEMRRRSRPLGSHTTSCSRSSRRP